MLAQMPYRVWREWQLYYRADPFDGKRGDVRTAQLSMIMANAWLRGKDRKPWTLEDWLPKYENDPEPVRETEAERAERLLDYVRDLNVIFGGETIDGTRNNAGQADSPN